MLALRWHGRGDVRLDEVEAPPPPGPGEVQLRPLWCGICGTDVEEYRSGPLFIPSGEPHPLTGRSAPITLGHEFSGEVVDVGPGVERFRPGDRVAADTLIFCGECYWCRRHQVTLCERLAALGLMADGGLAGLCNAPERMLLPVPEGVSDEAGALAETLAVAVRALRRGRFVDGESVAVVGAGAVGSARKGGRVVLVGIYGHPGTLDFLEVVGTEKEIVGSLSHVYDEDFAAAVSLLGRGAVLAEPLVSDRVPLNRALDDGIIALMRDPEKYLKILIRASDSPHFHAG